jgi:hypothetical protein
MVDQPFPRRGEIRSRDGNILPQPTQIRHFAVISLDVLVYKVGLVKSLDQPTAFKVITHEIIRTNLRTCVGSAGTIAK